MRRLPMAALAAVLLALVLGAAAPAGARRPEGAVSTAPGRGHIDVVEVSGRIDPVLIDFLRRSVDKAERGDAQAVVLQLNSPGSVVGEGDLDRVVRQIETASVPVTVWIGPSGAQASGEAARLVDAADIAGMAPGTKLRPEDGGSFGPDEADAKGLVDSRAPTIGQFIVDLNGREVDGTTLHTAKVTETGNGPRLQPDVQVQFNKLGLAPRLMHTVASPSVAYLLLLAGLVLIVFEFFSAGVGVAGVVGAVSLVLAAYGLDVLPTTALGLALIGVSIFGFSVDVQTGVPRVWTGIGVVALVVGSLVLYDGISLSWVTLAAGVVLTVLMMLAGLPSVIRSRFSTPTIGREGMIGELGEAVQDVRPDGVVRVREALWRAHTNRATPIAAGGVVRVSGIDGPLLEVEPEEGGARDYRERVRQRREGG